MGIKHKEISGKKTYQELGLNQELDLRDTLTYGTFEVGAGLALIPMLLQAQLVGFYDHALSGERKMILLNENYSHKKLDTGSSMGIKGRLLLKMFPFISAGLEAGWQSNSTKFKNDSELEKNQKSAGYSLGLAIGVNI